MKRVACFFFGTDPITTVIGYLSAIVVAMQATHARPEANYLDYVLAIVLAVLGRASGDAREYKKPSPPPNSTPITDTTPIESNGQENKEQR